jgi:tetratricopeptide (TPR) repeat protein
LSFAEATELFKFRGIKEDDPQGLEKLRETWSLTEGHPLWMNLIAVQMHRNPSTAPKIIEELKKGKIDARARSMFKALWQGLNEKQRIVLRCMAELPYAETDESIGNFAAPLIKSRNQFQRAFNGLRALSLVIEREASSDKSKFDLHPLVRNFIRTEYPGRQERARFIVTVLGVLDRFVKSIPSLSEDTPPETLQRWTAKAELELAADNTINAIQTLNHAEDQLIARGFQEELLRIAKLILDQVDWSSEEMQSSDEFHSIVEASLITLIEYKREIEARVYLQKYQHSIHKGTVAHVRFCKAASYLEWYLGNYKQAIDLASEGSKLKEESNIDTKYDCSNTLALALRDSGKYDEALSIFEPEQTIEEVLEDDHRTSGKSADFYGNFGRCLQFKGQIENALQSFVKSADLLQGQHSSTEVLNRGYAALWIGELLESKRDFSNAYLFYKQAANIWYKRAPLRAEGPVAKMNNIAHLTDRKWDSMGETSIDKYCSLWIENQLKIYRTG